ncbi:MAG: hypothetical protein Q8Q31_05900 [Nanoarchaeota archaeon]|nr:hypothetical protein [Nanoarchaeota archaeon]
MKVTREIPEVLYWDDWLGHVIEEGMTFSKLRGTIGDQIRGAQSKIGYDMPPNQNDLLLNRFECFMSMQFGDFRINPNLSDTDLYLLTCALKRHEEKAHPRESFSQLEYYGPAFTDVEVGFSAGDSQRLRRGIDSLIDKKLHD